MEIDIEVTLNYLKGRNNCVPLRGRGNTITARWLGKNKKIIELVDSYLWLEEF